MFIEGLDCAVMTFYHVSLWYEKVDVTQVASTTSPEEFVRATLLLWLGLTLITLIRHENRAFRKKKKRRNNHVTLM